MFDAEELVKGAVERHGDKIAVACSFGKDSMVVLDMALRCDPDIKVIFENTGVEFPETIEFKDRIKEQWNLNLYETKPLKSFWACVDEYGLPTVRKKGGKGSNAPKCCKYLKEKPGEILQKKLGVDAILTGIQACESQNRFKLAKRFENKNTPYTEKVYRGEVVEFCGQRWFTRNTATWMYHPIMFWSVDDVWKHTYFTGLPVNQVYSKWKGLYPRCGCLPCTAYSSWTDRLPISHPQVFKILMEKEGQAILA